MRVFDLRKKVIKKYQHFIDKRRWETIVKSTKSDVLYLLRRYNRYIKRELTLLVASVKVEVLCTGKDSI